MSDTFKRLWCMEHLNKQVTRGHNIAADGSGGRAGAYNLIHTLPLPMLTNTNGQSQLQHDIGTFPHS